MSARAFFDTNILIYTLEASDPRAEVAERLLASGGTVNVQVINEFVAVTRRKLRLDWPDVAKGLRRDPTSVRPPFAVDRRGSSAGDSDRASTWLRHL